MKDYETFKNLNEEKYHAYYIPFSIDDKPKRKYGIIDRYSSSKVLSLNGIWNIKEYERYEDVNILDSPKSEIKVPSCVQIEGYDQLMYINMRFPMPVNPPYVSPLNPTWHYSKEININKKTRNSYYLTFLGVDSFFYLYVNKNLVGYASISHAIHEFDISKYLVNGTNIVDVVVLKLSAGTYLEAQDKLRFSGIFRDVYLVERPKKHITDYKIETDYVDGKGILRFINLSNLEINLEFNKKCYVVSKKATLELFNIDCLPWSSENPNLYPLTLRANGEVIYEEIGFRSIKIEGNVFKFNHEAIKIKGVNRHDFSNKTGATVSLRDIYLDLKVIKSLGCNAIRTSHYPNSPEFYLLCDKMGLMVLAEADLETHGAAIYQTGYSRPLWQQFVEEGIFEEGIYLREKSLVDTLKNFTSIFMWSLGNESSFGHDFFKGSKYIRKTDSRPIHYEGLQNAKKYYYTKMVDVVSMMYPSLDKIKNEVLNNQKETRPFILCEYSHSMGNSNGDLVDYWELINNNPNMMGGFVWEFKDHGLLINGKYYYGGDFGEEFHDGNFCIDGLVNPDRTLKSNAYELRAVHLGKEEIKKEISIPSPELTDKKINVLFDDNTANIKQITYNNKQILLENTRINVNRYIDNEIPKQNQYRNSYYFDKLKQYVIYSNVNNNKYFYKGYLAALGMKPLLNYELNYVINNNCLEIEFNYEISDFANNIPRVGIEFILPKEFDKFSYIGYGPYESYIDKHLASDYGYYESNSKDNYFDYIMPQESGSHYNTDYVKIKDLVEIISDNSFSFSINPYKTKELVNAKHNYELKEKDNKVVLNLDLFMRGVGSQSCGPELALKYEGSKKGSNKFKLFFE